MIGNLVRPGTRAAAYADSDHRGLSGSVLSLRQEAALQDLGSSLSSCLASNLKCMAIEPAMFLPPSRARAILLNGSLSSAIEPCLQSRSQETWAKQGP